MGKSNESKACYAGGKSGARVWNLDPGSCSKLHEPSRGRPCFVGGKPWAHVQHVDPVQRPISSSGKLEIANAHAHKIHCWKRACFVGGKSRARVWNMEPAQSSMSSAGELETGAGAGGSFRSLQWHPSDPEQLVTVSESRLRKWTIRGSSIDVRLLSNFGYAFKHDLFACACLQNISTSVRRTRRNS